MFDKIEYYNGAIKGSKLCLLINALLIIHFIWFWYKNYRKWGWKLDFWTLVTARFFLVHVLFMYPFNGSAKNIIAFDEEDLQKIDLFLDKAYIISILGYISMHVGRFLYSLRSDHRFLDFLFRPIEKITEKNIKNPVSSNLILWIGFFFLAVVLYFQIITDNLFSPRTFFQSNGSLRPIYNLCLIFYPMAILIAGLRLLNKPSLQKKISFIFLVVFSAFLGTRMAILEPILILFGFYCIKNNYKINVQKIMVIGLLFIYSTILVLSLRASESSESNTTIKSVLYGTTFSDTRDFAFVLSHWDHDFVRGKTYIAGLLSFIPRELSEFRDKWALGIFTADVTKYNSADFPGFRPGFFGEVYFNFGLYGVIFLGLIAGYVLRHVDLQIKRSELYHTDIIKAYTKTIMWTLITCMSISIGFISLYVFLFINICLWVIRKLIAFINSYNYSNVSNLHLSNKE